MNPIQQETPEQAAERLYPSDGDYFNRGGVIAAYIKGREDERQAQNGWIAVKDRLPPLQQYVLIFYKIKESEYTEIAMLQSITDYGEGITTDWRDKNWDHPTPTHWAPLLAKP
jgi:hypothetical protein